MGLFRKNKNVFKTRITTDEPITRKQLLDSLNNIATQLRNVTVMINRMNEDSDRRDDK